MNEHDTKIAKQVTDVITNTKYKIIGLISELKEIKDYTRDSEKLEIIDDLIKRLTAMKSITPEDLGLHKEGDTYVVGDDFNDPRYHGYASRERRYNRLDQEEMEAERKHKWAKMKRLEGKKGRIMNKQLKVTKKILKTNLYEFQQSRETFLKSVEKEINNLKNASNTKALLAEVKRDQLMKRAANRGENPRIPEGKQNDYIFRRTQEMRSKIGIIHTELNKTLATNVSEKRRNAMREAGRIIGNVLNRIKYFIPNRIEDIKEAFGR